MRIPPVSVASTSMPCSGARGIDGKAPSDREPHAGGHLSALPRIRLLRVVGARRLTPHIIDKDRPSRDFTASAFSRLRSFRNLRWSLVPTSRRTCKAIFRRFAKDRSGSRDLSYGSHQQAWQLRRDRRRGGVWQKDLSIKDCAASWPILRRLNWKP